MNPRKTPPPPGGRDADEEVSALIETLHQTEQRLEQLTSGEVDTVADRHGRTFLLRRAQDQLRHNEAAKQAAILNALPAYIALLDTQGRIISVNEAWQRFGSANVLHGPGYEVGLNYLQICDSAQGDDASETHQVAEAIRSMLGGGVKSFSIEYPCHSPTEQRWFLMTVTPLADGHPNGVVVMHLDVTAKRQNEERRRAAELKFREMAENIRDVFSLRDADGTRILYVSPAYEEIWGRSCESLYANPESWAETIHPDDRASTYEKNEKGMLAERFEFEYRIVRPDGSIRWIESRGFPVRDDAGNLVRIAGVAKDITERKQVEAELRLQSAALNAAANSIVITDRNGTIEWVNPAFTALTGYRAEEAIGKNQGELIKSGIHDQVFYQDLWDTILAGHTWQGEMTNRRKDRSVYIVDQTITSVKGARGETDHFIGIGRDLTERKTLEAQVRQASKMDAVGKLASGVAHDFNNLLTVILGFADLMAADAAMASEHGTDLGEIIKAARRAEALTGQLLAFSRQQVLHVAPVDVNGLITDMTGMLVRLIGEHIEVSLALTPNLSLALADRGQLEQVVMNLVVNARDAMPDGGSVTIETREVELENSSFHAETVMHGRYVMLAITDTGSGMTKETQRRLFEPFFTTKEAGQGTGLGLSTTYGIVKQSKGYIWVYSEPGRGTTFKVYLPCSNRELPLQAVNSVVTAPVKRPSETVLLVEDEASVRQLAKRILENAGYRVLEAANGDEGERLFAQHSGSIDLLVTDVIMPGCGGPELLNRLHVQSPALRVLYMSGYTEQSAAIKTGIDRGTPFVQKPFTATEFVRQVREALDR